MFSHQPGKVANDDTGDVADDAYHRFETDLSLLQSLHVNAYRFSLSWSRLVDDNGNANADGIAHYNTIIDLLVKTGIEPVVTLYHWDLPLRHSTMVGQGGWLNVTYIEPLYLNYTSIAFTAFGDRVKKWIIFNEPHSFCMNGFQSGTLAPGRCSNRTTCPEGDSSTEPYLCSHTVLLTYIAVVKQYRTQFEPTFGKAMLGMSIDGAMSYPSDMNSPDDATAAVRNMEFNLVYYSDPLYFGDYPASMKQLLGSRLPAFTDQQKQDFLNNKPDFLGYNHYTSIYVANDPNTPPSNDAAVLASPYNASGHLIGPQAASTWLYVYPPGFNDVLQFLYNRYKNAVPSLQIMCTENGVDVPGESDMPLSEALNDTFRVNYLTDYLSSLETAVQAGVNVAGYFVWSLLDNFEWAVSATRCLCSCSSFQACSMVQSDSFQLFSCNVILCCVRLLFRMVTRSVLGFTMSTTLH